VQTLGIYIISIFECQNLEAIKSCKNYMIDGK